MLIKVVCGISWFFVIWVFTGDACTSKVLSVLFWTFVGFRVPSEFAVLLCDFFL